jgi:glycosyltransferase involved in cell wall biosynthesis
VSERTSADGPRLLVFSSLFPSAAQPGAGVFIRERMFRVGQHLPIVVVAPQAWFPMQGLIRRFRPHFRPPASRFEVMQGVEVHRPRFLSFPGILKWADGFFLAVASFLTVRRLVRRHRLNVLDVHFGYPDGFAGVLLGRWVGLPVVLTLRGKEERQARMDVARALKWAIRSADWVVTVSEALRKLAIDAGVAPERATVIGNGVDLTKFSALPMTAARAELGLPADAEVLVSVGTLVERKGFHRVIACLPALVARHPRLHFLIVGGAGAEGDISARLQAQVAELNLSGRVHFLGPYSPERLRVPLSAADVFVLATSYEGWANVFLEAMACGLPVVTTRVGGNAEVVSSPQLGSVVQFGDQLALTEAIHDALTRGWERADIVAFAQSNRWEERIPPLLEVFARVHADRTTPRTAVNVEARIGHG